MQLTLVKVVTHRPWASAENFPGAGNVGISLILFQVANDAMQMDFHKTLSPF